jgi:hypothetical protein
VARSVPFRSSETTPSRQSRGACGPTAQIGCRAPSRLPGWAVCNRSPWRHSPRSRGRRRGAGAPCAWSSTGGGVVRSRTSRSGGGYAAPTTFGWKRSAVRCWRSGRHTRGGASCSPATVVADRCNPCRTRSQRTGAGGGHRRPGHQPPVPRRGLRRPDVPELPLGGDARPSGAGRRFAAGGSTGGGRRVAGRRPLRAACVGGADPTDRRLHASVLVLPAVALRTKRLVGGGTRLGSRIPVSATPRPFGYASTWAPGSAC